MGANDAKGKQSAVTADQVNDHADSDDWCEPTKLETTYHAIGREATRQRDRAAVATFNALSFVEACS